jgi:hypothetical protein
VSVTESSVLQAAKSASQVPPSATDTGLEQQSGAHITP